MARLSESISSNIGLNFPEKRWPDLKRNILMMERELRLGSVLSCVHWLLGEATKQEREDLFIRYLTIGETSFFRDKTVWHLLKHKIIPERMSARKHGQPVLKFWSAACSSGEEPYSMAMTVSQIPALKNWQTTILATDINNISLEKGRAGVYTKWSFRNTSPWLQANYFSKKNDNAFTLSPAIKSMVTFRQLNLAGNSYPSAANNTTDIDIIFCRNVLMYFPQELCNRIISRLASSLAPGGWLLLAASEAGFVSNPALHCQCVDGVFVFRRQQETSPAPDMTENPPAPPIRVSPQPQHSPPTSQKRIGSGNEQDCAEQALENNGTSSSSLLFEGAEALFMAGRYEESREILQKILDGTELHEKNKRLQTKSLKLLAKTYANQGSLAMARSFGEQAVSNEKFNPMHYYFLATVCLEQGDETEAVKLLKKAIYLDGAFVLAYFLLASLVRNDKEKKKHLQNVVSLLQNVDSEEILPGSDGQTSGWVKETAANMLDRLKSR